MCLAEALLRIPDRATRDALIRGKINGGDWWAPSLFANAATWGLVVTGKPVGSVDEGGLSAAVERLIVHGGEPVIRKGVDLAMRLLGEQFVTGQTIAEALRNSRRLEAKGFRYSYDVLGEAAVTAEDAARYHRSYEQAIHAIGCAAQGRGPYDGPGMTEFDAVLFEGDTAALLALAQDMAGRPDPIVPVHVAGPDESYLLEWLVWESALSTNTTVAGGNATLMMID